MAIDYTIPKDDLKFEKTPGRFRAISVKDKDLTAPPGAPAEGDSYIVGAAATGLWDGHDDEIAEWHAYEGVDAAWCFIPIAEDGAGNGLNVGFRVYVVDETTDYEWNGTSWAKVMTSQLTYVAEYGCYVVS